MTFESWPLKLLFLLLSLREEHTNKHAKKAYNFIGENIPLCDLVLLGPMYLSQAYLFSKITFCRICRTRDADRRRESSRACEATTTSRTERRTSGSGARGSGNWRVARGRL